MIWAVIYGYTPIASREKLRIVPPESKFRKPKKPPEPACELKKFARASRFTPGAGMFAAIRNNIKIPRVINSFFRISSERHKNRHADCFFSGILENSF